MRGKATDKSGQKPLTISDLEVLKWMHLWPFTVEITVRRLKWLQSMLAFPDQHTMVLTAIFQKDYGGTEVEESP